LVCDEVNKAELCLTKLVYNLQL